MKKVKECKNIDDIRGSIDVIDKEIIYLIAKRAKYVYATSKFKKDTKSVKATDRVKSMLQKRGEWAEKKKLDPKIIIKIFSELVNYFVKREMAKWKEDNKA